MLAAALLPLALATTAGAQTTDGSTVGAAADAFGTSVGRESIGLYSPSDVRGFSPYAAGNIRLEGLYIDAVALPNNRLTSGSTIRVGVSAQGYPFAAPTGVADFRLRLPGEDRRTSLVVGADSYGGVNGEVNLQLPITPSAALGAGLTVSDDTTYWGGEATHITAAALLRWRPRENIEVIPFASYFAHRNEPTNPRLVIEGDHLPPELERVEYYGQNWTRWTMEDLNFGGLLRADMGAWRLASGVFRSIRQRDINYSDQFLGVAPDGFAPRHRVVISPGSRTAATSGEARLSRTFNEGSRQHMFHLSLRAREQTRAYGGGVSVDLGPGRVQCRAQAAEPLAELGPQARDRIRQGWAGVAYQGQWPGVGELSAGLQKTSYRKVTEAPGLQDLVTEAEPWLYGATLALEAPGPLVLYGSFTRGLEESAAAPEVASNRDEAPPAIRTQQYDAGLRWDIVRGVRLVTGVFSVEKPYFALDPARVYRRLGEVRHRGVELSLSGRPAPSLTLLAGAVLLDATVDVDGPQASAVGPRPVGAVSRTLTLNAEYSPPSAPGLVLDVGVENVGPRVANTANTFKVPGSTVLNLGLRYRLRMAGRPATLRAQVNNVFDTYRWELVASNTYAYDRPREVSVRLTTEF